MKIIAGILLVSNFIFKSGLCQPFSIDSLKLKIETYRLRNGIQVVLQPDPKQTQISIEFWVRTGAKDEEPGKFGLTHFCEHVTPPGLGSDSNMLNQFKLFRTNSNAQTRKDYTRYYIQVKPEGLSIGLRYAADRLSANITRITGEDLEVHRRNVLSEMCRQEMKPLYSPSATAVRDAITFGNEHPYGHGTYGTIAEVNNFSVKDVREWHLQHFSPGNVVLFIVGNFEVKKAKSVIKKEFAGLIKRKAAVEKNHSPPQSTQGDFSLPTQSDSHFLTITWPIPGWKSADVEKLELLSYILDERLANRSHGFFKEAGSSALFNLYGLAGQFGVFARFSFVSDSNKVSEFLQHIKDEISEKPVSNDELYRAKKRSIAVIGNKMKKLGFIESRTEILGEGIMYGSNPGYYLERIKRQLLITATDIQLSSKKWLDTTGARLLLISGNHVDSELSD